MFKANWTALCIAAAAVFSAVPMVSHAADAGRVTGAKGEIAVIRGKAQLPVVVGTTLQAKDEIQSGATGQAKWELVDGSKFTIPRNTNFRIDDFSPKSSSSGGQAIFTLLKGAFRTVSGLIGKSTGDTYSMNTPVATMGIRGTDYAAVLKNDGGKKQPDGLYVVVNKGKVVVKNAAGSIELSAGQSGYVKDANTKPALSADAAAVFAAAGLKIDGDIESSFQSASYGGANLDLRTNVQLDTKIEPLPSPGSPEPPGVPPPPVLTPTPYGAAGAGMAISPNGARVNTDVGVPAVQDQQKIQRGVYIEIPPGQQPAPAIVETGVGAELTPRGARIDEKIDTPAVKDQRSILIEFPMELPEIPASPS